MRRLRQPRLFQHRVEPVLGTRFDLSVRVGSSRAADRIVHLLLDEITRLEAVYSVYQADSELSRWKRGEIDAASASEDLFELLRLGATWFDRTSGVFNPNLGVLTARWRQAETDGVVPSGNELAELCDRASRLPYTVSGRVLERIGDCSALDFNALAKGLIVDRSVQAVVANQSIPTLMLNLGGDLLHRGESSVMVHVEDPQHRAMGATPLTSIAVANAAAATSGTSWRGFTVGGQRLGHVLDPQTGWPSERVSSATVVAADAATADVMATVMTVLDPDASVALIGSHDCGVNDFFILGTHGQRRWSATWPNAST